jgi:hypothetical protein
MTANPIWESYPVPEASAAACERCGSPATVKCFDHEVTDPPQVLLLCSRCSDLERGRRMAVGLKEHLKGFPEQPTEDDLLQLARHLKYLGDEEHSESDPPSSA